MALTVISVGYPLAPVGPDAVGGAEQVLGWIDRALVRAGHRSIVVAPRGSTVAGELVEISAHPGPLTEEVRARAQDEVRRTLEKLLRERRPGLVHFHGIDFAACLPEGPVEVPMLATLHLPPAWYPPEIFALPERGVLLQCVSESQRSRCPPGARIAAVISNGVDLEALRPSRERERRRRSSLVALGRICPEKGFHLAVEAARRADALLVLAGQVFGYEAHQAYFENELRPLLDRRRRFIGPVGLARKRALLSRARALLVPSLVEETSSLVAMEAMACDTPVIAFRAGALSEVVEHGRTGFLVDSVEEMAEAIERLDTLPPGACRQAAEARFSGARMAEQYLALYAAAGKGGRLLFGGTPRVEAITSLEGLEALRSSWLRLWADDAKAGPFLHPDWLLPWCHHFDRSSLRSFAAFVDGRLVGLAPMEVTREGDRRTLKLLGSGVSDALDALVLPTAPGALDALLTAMKTSSEWDRLTLEPLAEGAHLEAAGEGVEIADVSPVLPLPSSIAELPLASRLRANARYCRRKLERTAPVRLHTASVSDTGVWMGRLFALHRARWGMRGEPGVLDSARVRAFHLEAAEGFARAGLLRLHALLHGEHPFAIFYGFAAHGTLHYYLSGFDPAYEKASPGTLLLLAVIEEAIRRGDQRFDFLRGAEPYKYAWGARDRPLWRVQLPLRPAAGEELPG